MSADIVVIEYTALLEDPGESDASNELQEKLIAAFGTDKSLGIVAIRGVPRFLDARTTFLPMAHRLAHLPHDYLENELGDPKIWVPIVGKVNEGSSEEK